MNWEDQGFLLNKRKFRENANIINVFTYERGKVSGIVYGGTSRKVKNYLQVGNKIFVFYNSNNSNKSGYFKTEIVEAVSPRYFDDKKRSYCILAISQLLDSLLPESQEYKKIFISLDNLVKNIEYDNWMIIYLYWELNLIKELGFGFTLEKTNANDELISINIDNLVYKIPRFIVNGEIPSKLSNKTINASLKFTRNLLLNKFYLPNNLNFPKSRLVFENYFN